MPNLASLLSAGLSASQHDLLKSASRIADRLGVDLYLVGGAVRDLLLARRPNPPDLSAVGAATDFPAALAKALGGQVTADSQFGTAKLRVRETLVDLALARKESYARPGALPTVEPGSIEDDLARRDFSVNAMAVSLNPGDWGELSDPFDGAGDLKRRLIKVLHPLSFQDDPTRLFRAVRFSGRIDFTFESDTNRLMRDGLRFLESVSGDRVRHEIELVFQEQSVVAILQLAEQLGLLAAVYPSLSLTPGLAGASSDLEADRELVLLSSLVYSVPRNDLDAVVRRLNLGTDWSRVAADAVAVRDTMSELGRTLPPSRVYALLHGRHEAAISVCALAAVPEAAENLAHYLTRLRHVRASLNGDDLIAMGVSQGPTVGELLRELLDARLDGLVDSVHGEREIVARRITHGGPPD